MTDSPISPPQGWIERGTAAIGNLARPYVLIVASTSSGIATIALAIRTVSLIEAAAFVAANWAGVGALYGAKALEEGRKAKATAEVEVAKVNAGTPT